MAWPSTVLDIVVEIYVPTIGWVDISSYVRRDGGSGVRIQDGMTGTEQRRASPSRCSFKLNNRDGRFSPRNPASPYAGLLYINTEIHVTIEGEVQFWGEVGSGWPTRWTTGGHDAWVPMEAFGRSARINADDTPLQGPLYDKLQAGIDYYWPLTDPDSATFATPVPSTVGLTSPPLLHPWGLNAPEFAGVAGPPASKPTPDFGNRGGLSAALTDGLSNASFYVALWFKLDSGDTGDFGVMSLYQLSLAANTGNVMGFDLCITAGLGVNTPGLNRIGITASAYTAYPQGAANRSADMQFITLGTPCTQDDWHLIRVVYTESGGAITQTVYLDNVLIGSDTGTAAGYSLEALSNITLGANDSSGLHAAPWTQNSGVGLRSLGHLVIQTAIIGDIGIYEAGTGHPGETAGVRMQRLCAANAINITFTGDPDLTSTMTAQRAGGTLAGLLEECAQADGGLLFDARDALGLHYVTRIALYNRTAALALDYTLKAEVMPALEMDESSFTVVNDITAVSPVGEVRVQQLIGPRNVDEPNDGTGGVGRYPGRLAVDLDTVSQLADAAAWALRLSTADVPRFTAINVNLRALAAAGKTSLWQDAGGVGIGDVITITNTPIWIPDDVACFAVGRTLRAANLEYDIAYNTIDATSWLNIGGPLEDTVYGRGDSEDTYLSFGYSAAATSMRVVNTGEEHIPTLWTAADGSYDVMIDDEQMTVTAVSTIAPAYLSTGTAAYADNASVSPGIPGGFTTGGHLLVLFAYARSPSTTVNLPAGWTFLSGMPGSNGLVACKIHSGSESAPTVTFTGGSAGDTHGAVIASFVGLQARHGISDLRGVDTVPYDANFGTSQDIAVPAMGATRDNVAIMQFGAKADDWTSVATLSGGTEVYDGSSTLGNDLGMVWNFRAQTTRGDVAAQTFTVTGGASAAWDSCIMIIDGNMQQFTVTRGVNGTTAAAHAAGAQVRLANPMILGR